MKFLSLKVLKDTIILLMINVIFSMVVKKDAINVIHGILIIVQNVILIIIKKIYIIKLNRKLSIVSMKLLAKE